jgi:acid phosphatase (class A)
LLVGVFLTNSGLMKISRTTKFEFTRHWALIGAVFCTLVSSSLWANGPYLGSDAPDAVLLLPPPPALGSPEDVADREASLQIYSDRTPEQVALGKAEEKLTIFHLTPSVGAWFQAGKFPKTEALFKEVETESSKIAGRGKVQWKRLRPYVAEPAHFPDAIEHETNASAGYPSGHSTRATVYALLLVELFPEHRDEILAKGRESGWLRVQGGVHTPLDIYAGRTIGQAIAQALLRNPAFQHDFAEVKAEIAAAKRPTLALSSSSRCKTLQRRAHEGQ